MDHVQPHRALVRARQLSEILHRYLDDTETNTRDNLLELIHQIQEFGSEFEPIDSMDFHLACGGLGCLQCGVVDDGDVVDDEDGHQDIWVSLYRSIIRISMIPYVYGRVDFVLPIFLSLRSVVRIDSVKKEFDAWHIIGNLLSLYSNDDLRRLGLIILYNVCLVDTNRQTLITTGLLPVIVTIMKNCGPAIAIEACAVITSLASGPSANYRAYSLAWTGSPRKKTWLCESVLHVMSHYPMNVMLQYEACNALSMMAYSPSCEDLIVKNGGQT